MTEVTKRTLEGYIIRLVEDVEVEEQPDEVEDEGNPPEEESPMQRLKRNKNSGNRDLFEDESSAVQKELNVYFKMNEPHRRVSLLDFWKRHRELLPLLSRAAQSILAVPCSTSSVERVFSVAGNTVTNRRKSLTPKLVEQIVVMHSNKGLIDFKDFREEREECSSSDEDEVESGHEDEVEENDSEEENEGDNEGDDDGNINDSQTQSLNSTQLTQLNMHNYFSPVEKSRNNSNQSQERRTRTSQEAAQSRLAQEEDQQEEDEQDVHLQEEDEQDEHQQGEHEQDEHQQEEDEQKSSNKKGFLQHVGLQRAKKIPAAKKNNKML